MAKFCQGCHHEFVSAELYVMEDGSLYCATCTPEINKRITISLRLSWDEALALEKFIDGNVELSVLDTVDQIKYDLRSHIAVIARKLNAKIQKSNPESMG